MAKVILSGERQFLEQLKIEFETANLADDVSLLQAAEPERLLLGFDDAATLVGVIAGGTQVVQIAVAIVRASLKSKTSSLDLKTPSGRIKLDISGKSELEISRVIKAAYPFLRDNES